MADYPYPFHPKTIHIDGHNLSYLDEGQGDAIVMLHGNPTWSFFYRDLILSLRDRYRIIVPDHMGCGLSDKPSNYSYTLAKHISNLSCLLGQLQIKNLTLIVHDWGGAIGMGWAVKNPNLIKALIIMNTAAFPCKQIPLRISVCRLPIFGSLCIRGLNMFSRAALSMAVTKPLEPEVAAGYLAPYDSWENRIAVLRFVQDIPMSPNHPSWQTLVSIDEKLSLFRKTPMLLLWGGKDFCFNKLFYELWCQRFPDATRKYMENAGHYLLEDDFDLAEESIQQFLQSN